MVLADSIRISRVPTYSGYSLQIYQNFDYRIITFYDPASQLCSSILIYPISQVPLPQSNDWFRLFPVRSPLLRESLLLSLPPLT